MNRFWTWHAFWARPTTLLTLTEHTATLAPIADPHTPYATCAPTPLLITTHGTLAAGFQLKRFIDASIPIHAKKPFSLIVKIPSRSPQLHHLAVEIGALLLQLALPAYCITTTDITPTTRCAALTDILHQSPPCSLPVFRMLSISTGLCIMSTLISVCAATLWRTKPLPIQQEALTPSSYSIPPKEDLLPVCTLLATAMALHRWNNQLIKLQGSQNVHTYTSIMTNPAYAEIITKALNDATHCRWKPQKQRYRPGMPPLYEVTHRVENS
jgi:hypothetical protein